MPAVGIPRGPAPHGGTSTTDPKPLARVLEAGHRTGDLRSDGDPPAVGCRAMGDLVLAALDTVG